MTVLVRPAPARVAGNRVVPFRQVQYTNKVRPVALKDWKPPVPEPLQPAPLLGLGTLAVLGLQALAFAWGQLNSRPQSAEVVPPHTGTTISGAVPPAGNTVGASLTITESAYSHSYYVNDCVQVQNSSGPGDSYTLTNVKGIKFEKVGSGCFGLPTQLRWVVEHTDYRETALRNITSGANGTIAWNRSYSLNWDHPSAVPHAPEVSQLPLPDGFVWPEVEPQPETEPATLPSPLPLPLPSKVPQVVPITEPQTLPAPSPLVPVTPGPVAPPIIQPATPLSPRPPQIPATTGISNGSVIAPAPGKVPVTSATSIIPWPGASSIGTPGQAPRADLAGIAQEVGKIERKLELMNGAGKDLVPDGPKDLFQLARGLWELLSASLGAPTYTLDSPCAVDENGDKLPAVQVPVNPALTSLDSISNRIDALAELLQVHKDLKQPNCHLPPVAVGGEFVTVNFEQID